MIDGQLISLSLFSGAGGLDLGMNTELQEFFIIPPALHLC
ncbi:DNA cytosine methyltransferase [Microcoleus sp. FACHB-68]|nr:DNA cytosine methyltransferase [Microcoleus sp. FACHB-68]